MIAEPTIALEMPPLVSPKGPVGVVRKSRLIAPSPLSRTEPTTITSTATASRAAIVEATSTSRLNRLRRFRLPRSSSSACPPATQPPRLASVTSVSSILPRWTIIRAITLTRRRRRAGSAPDRPARISAGARRALELGRDLGGHGAAGVEEGGIYRGRAADHLGDRDRLADRPAEAEDRGADDARRE